MQREASMAKKTLSFECQDPLVEVNLGTNKEPRMTKVCGLLLKES